MILKSSDYEAAREVSESSEATDNNSVVENTGNNQVKFKQWAKLKKTIGVVALAAVAVACALTAGHFVGVYVKENSANASRADKNEQLAEEEGNRADQNAEEARENAQSAYNAVGGLVTNAFSNINKATTTYNTANNFVSQLEGTSEVEDEEIATAFASLSQNVREETASDLSKLLSEAQTSLNSANTEYEQMIASRTELNEQYEAGNWTEVNTINESITTNSSNIASYTDDANAKANEVISSLNELIEQAQESIKEAEESLAQTKATAEKLYAGLPAFASAVSDSLDLISTSISSIESYVNKGADEQTQSQLETLLLSAETSQNNAQNSKITFDALYAQIESNFQAENYNTVLELMNSLTDTVQSIANESAIASQDALDAADVYAEYQQAVNDELSKVTLNIEFTDADLSNYQGITKYLINANLGGRVNSVDQCVYNKNSGEVTILLNCTSIDGTEYVNLITGNIATGLSELTPTTLIDRLKNVTTQSQVYDLNMSLSNSSATVGEITGDCQIQYSIDTKYNSKTGKTTITANAILIVRDADGNVSYKTYTISPALRDGRLTEDDVKLEYESKLSSMILSDTSITLTDEENNSSLEY